MKKKILLSENWAELIAADREENECQDSIERVGSAAMESQMENVKMKKRGEKPVVNN